MAAIEARWRCVTGLLLTLMAPVLAAQDLPPEFMACRTEPDAAKRLACYDRHLDATIQSAPEPAQTDAGSPAVTPAAEERFGLEGTLARSERQQAREEGRELLELSSTVTRLTSRADGVLVITLANGQVWAPKEFDPNVVLRVGDPVRIRRGAMGSYVLNGRSSWSTRVRRLQ